MPPRGLDPSGIILVDKPAGPTSFDDRRGDAAADRGAHGARGNARPVRDRAPAAPLRARRRASSRGSSASPKRYVTEIDLSARTSTGDLEGERRRRARAAGPRRARRRARRLCAASVELPIPAVSAVKIDGRARVRAPPPRRRGRDAASARCTSTSSTLEGYARRRRAARPARLVGDVRPRDRGGARRPLP